MFWQDKINFRFIEFFLYFGKVFIFLGDILNWKFVQKKFNEVIFKKNLWKNNIALFYFVEKYVLTFLKSSFSFTI